MTALPVEASPRGERWFSSPRAALTAALLGAGVYLIQAWSYAHSQASVMDEGLYLYKGFLFTEGVYPPFQDFGPLTNHMPLSFLVPGAFQQTFGPGLRTGRFAALALGMLMLLGLWLAGKPLGGRWVAAPVAASRPYCTAW